MIDECIWEIQKIFFQKNSLIKQHIESYDLFITNTIKKIIDDFKISKLDANTFIKIDNLKFTEPIHIEMDGTISLLFPQEARLRGLTYSISMYVDIIILDEKMEKQDESLNCLLGKIPVMVNSKMCNLTLHPELNRSNTECENDTGGYFIVNGTEKVIITQEKMSVLLIVVGINFKIIDLCTACDFNFFFL